MTAIPEWLYQELRDTLTELTESKLRPALAEAGVQDPERYRLALSREPARGCEHRTLVADFPSGFAPIVPECGCDP